MNTLMLIGGVGIGFTISSCLSFYVLASATRGSKKQQEDTRRHLAVTEKLLTERNEIDRKVCGHLHTLAQCAAMAHADKPQESGVGGTFTGKPH